MSSKAKDDCYKLIQMIALARDKGCQNPECSRLGEAGHHLFKRDRLATAFDPEAVIGLCTQCHTGFAHNHPRLFKEFMVERMGDRYYQLRRRSSEAVKDMDYVAKRVELRGILESFRKKAVNF